MYYLNNTFGTGLKVSSLSGSVMFRLIAPTGYFIPTL